VLPKVLGAPGPCRGARDRLAEQSATGGPAPHTSAAGTAPLGVTRLEVGTGLPTMTSPDRRIRQRANVDRGLTSTAGRTAAGYLLPFLDLVLAVSLGHLDRRRSEARIEAGHRPGACDVIVRSEPVYFLDGASVHALLDGGEAPQTNGRLRVSSATRAAMWPPGFLRHRSAVREIARLDKRRSPTFARGNCLARCRGPVVPLNPRRRPTAPSSLMPFVCASCRHGNGPATRGNAKPVQCSG